MVSFRSIATLALAAGSVTASDAEAQTYDCGEVNVFYTGLPAYHPYVIEQGWDPVKVDLGIRNDTLNMVKAGFNVKVVLSDPKNGQEAIRKELDDDLHWHSTGVGYGVRPARIPQVVVYFEDLLQTFKEEAPESRMAFNNGPDSFLWSLDRRFPRKTDCEAENRPGQLLGYKVLFDQGYKGLELEEGLVPLDPKSKAFLAAATGKDEL